MFSLLLIVILLFYNFIIVLFLFRILVGAPLGENLQPGTNRSGALWKCPLTLSNDDCEQVVTDGKRSKYMVHCNILELLFKHV